MEHHSNIDDNIGTGVLGLITSSILFVLTQELTGEILHWISIPIGTVIAFLVQKLCKFLWEKYVEKK